MALSPATMATFPAPATSNPACQFLALGLPVDFASRAMRPIGWCAFGAQLLLHVNQSKHRHKRPRISVFTLMQILLLWVLHTDGRIHQPVLASPYCQRNANRRAPWLRRHYPASSLLRAHPPPSRLQPISRVLRLYGLPCSADFSTGRGRLLQLLGMSLSPCCPYHPAREICRISQSSTYPDAFVPEQWTRPLGFIFCRGHLWVHSRYGPVTRSPS